MSQELLLVLIPALIALGGTLFTVYFTVRQQRQQQKQDGSKPFTADQQAAYKGLWDKLEEVHVMMRTTDSALLKYNAALSEVNAFVLKNALYLDNDDQKLANQYLDSLKQITEIVNAHYTQNPESEAARTWSITETMAAPAMREFTPEEQAVIEKMETIRQKILEKCRRVLKSQ
jgi:hypothetical protein